MTFIFSINETGPYNAEQLENIRIALQYAGSIVQDAYQFERDINVEVYFLDLEDSGGGANGGTTGVYPINEVLYPNSLAKHDFTAQEWHANAPKYDIRIRFCVSENWYFGTDGNINNEQEDLVTYAVHEIHHGLGWQIPPMHLEGGGGDGPLRIVREPSSPIDVFEKFLCFKTTEDDYCPVAPYLLVEDTGLSVNEKANRQMKLARIFQSNNLYFCAGGTYIKLYAPIPYEFGANAVHIDFGEEENSVMEPYSTPTNAVQHWIGPTTRKIVNHMRNFHQGPPQECDCDKEPKMAPNTY